MEPRDEDAESGAASRSTSSKATAGMAAGGGKGKLRVAPAYDSASIAKDNANASPVTPTMTGQPHVLKRRRGVGVVTPNACNECRKKRVKCDGQTPCSRCRMQRDVECVYELPVRQSKEDLRAEIEQLRRRQRSSDTVLTALGRSELWGEIVRRLHNGESVDSIYEWLEAMPPQDRHQPPPPSQPSIQLPFVGNSGPPRPPFSPTAAGMPLLSPRLSGQAGQPTGGIGPRPGYANTTTTTTTSQSTSTHSNSRNDWTPSVPSQTRVGLWVQNTSQQDLPAGAGEPPLNRGLLNQILAPVVSGTGSTAMWTSVTSDVNLVHHLLALYFCWEYPTFASLSKEHFLRDFQDGRPRYCSAILVNALLALGCRFSSKPNTRSIPDDPFSSGDHFFDECQRLLDLEPDHHSLTTIQALGIMSIREASCGRDSESWYYAGQSIRLALEMNLNQVRDDGNDEDQVAVESATFWGAFALDHCWSLSTGSLPQSSWVPTLPPKPAIVDDIESSMWMPYTDDGKPLQRSCEQPSNVRSVYNCFCELSEIVHQSLYIMHCPGRPLHSRDLLRIYTQYLNWYDSIPEVLRLGHNFTPAVLFAHMYYHFAIMLLFRPLIKLRIVGSRIQPLEVCLQAADAVQGLLRSYSQLYTLQRTPSFVPYFVLAASIIHLAVGATSMNHATLQENEGLTTSGGYSKGTAKSDPWKFSPESTQSSYGSIHEQKMEQSTLEAINRGISDLAEMVPCHRFALQGLNILRFLARKWNTDVPISPIATQEPSIHFDSVDPSLHVRPETTSLNYFAADMRENDFNCDWGTSYRSTAVTEEARSVSLPASSSSLPNSDGENPLFWTFPMCGRPLLQSVNLEAAGFELL